MAVRRQYYQYSRKSTAEVAKFADALKSQSKNAATGVFDSAAATDFISCASNQSGITIPEKLQPVLDEAKASGAGGEAMVMRALFDGISTYEQQHGASASADLIEQAVYSAYSTTAQGVREAALDSATSLHQDNYSLQPNRAIVAIISAMGDAIPFAHYLPADIKSNEARLAIMTHNAGGDFGRYAANGLMDGTLSGGSYISSSRVHKCAIDGAGNCTGKITAIQDTDDTCLAGGATTKLVRGRSIVYVNGIQAAREVDQTGTGASTVSGSVTIVATTYQIGGTINTDTGVIALTTTPAIPTTVPVVVEAFIDYERAPELTPTIVSSVNVFTLFAKPWRVATYATIDSRTQMSNELGLDTFSESVVAIQAQFANERHYEVLRHAKRIAANNQCEFDFEWSARNGQMNRAQIWLDFAAILGERSQQMAVDTMNHGITHLYVGQMLAAQFMGLPREVFEPSGQAERPCIYRIGRLFGRYEVYYTPNVVTETTTSGQILCVGQATDVTRNPVVLGDAVSPTVIPLSVGIDLKQGAGFYARNFTAVNPHAPSARGFALINAINLK